MGYELRREGDGAGDVGAMCELIKYDENGALVRKTGKPEVGYCVRVGSMGARSYQYQDYWTTTPVLEVLEDRDNYVRFRTSNSMYEWTSF